MKKWFVLCAAALVAASLPVMAQNVNEALQQAEEQVRQKQDALQDAERAHREQRDASRRDIDAAQRQIDLNKETVDLAKKRIDAMKDDPALKPDRILLDPMFPERRKSSLVLRRGILRTTGNWSSMSESHHRFVWSAGSRQ